MLRRPVACVTKRFETVQEVLHSSVVLFILEYKHYLEYFGVELVFQQRNQKDS